MLFQIIIYWSYLCFPFLIFCYFQHKKLKTNYQKHKFKFYLNIFLVFLSLLFIYSRFIEPQIIVEHEHLIKTWFKWKIVVISDIHLWSYKSVNFLKRVVDKINNIKNVDAVLIAWDLTYIPNDSLDNLFVPFKNSKYKTFAVIWNHDDWHPWTPIENEVQKALQKYNIIYLNNEKSVIPNTNIKLLWLWDGWANNDEVNLIDNYKPDDNLIVLTHNPDTTMKYSKKESSIADITITGHTHWWQIRIPFYYKTIIPTTWNFNEWFYDYSWANVFVSSWLWEVGLPMRLGIPPVIDIINFQ